MSGLIMGLVGAHKFPDVKADPDAGLRYTVSGRTLKLLMLAVANRADDNGEGAHPGSTQLRDFAQVNQDTVRLGIKALIGGGYLIEDEPATYRRAAVYRVVVTRLLPDTVSDIGQFGSAGNPRTPARATRGPSAGRPADPSAGRPADPPRVDPRPTSYTSIRPNVLGDARGQGAEDDDPHAADVFIPGSGWGRAEAASDDQLPERPTRPPAGYRDRRPPPDPEPAPEPVTARRRRRRSYYGPS